jgi:hypothetical protein
VFQLQAQIKGLPQGPAMETTEDVNIVTLKVAQRKFVRLCNEVKLW